MFERFTDRARKVMKPTLDVATLLRLQQLAYELVIEISRRSAENPQWLNLEVADQIKTPEGAEKWLASQAGTIDKTRFPEDELRRPFINLFSAFFNTSFHFDIRQYRDELISARIEPQFMILSGERKSGSIMIPARSSSGT